LQFSDAQLLADPHYLPWSARAILLKETREMVWSSAVPYPT
jgi:hypothetical protein